MKPKIAHKTDTQNLVKSDNLFPVVGIGASAGGLTAFKKLIQAITPDSGMAYILVQHLDPNHESILPEILQKVSSIPVVEMTNTIKIEPNHVYVIPSNKMMVATDGILLLAPRPEKNKNERNLPIDLFFSSLAEIHNVHSIGVVLSGNASDGTIGLTAIKKRGGLTFAQDLISADYSGMPSSAINAGVVDFILSPDKIPEKLLEATQTSKLANASAQLPMEDQDLIQQIINLLRVRNGTDFTFYKQTTIQRRILRRMAINQNKNLTEYLHYLKQQKSEQDHLFQDLLISVTAFFRDKVVFEHLFTEIFPLIIRSKEGGDKIRIWVAGCSTGEEAYSIAISIKEFLTAKGLNKYEENIQIFATDLSEPAIKKSRLGIYTEQQVAGISKERLTEFFTKNNTKYQVNRQIRNMCIFAQHNFLKDPPFVKIDLLSCRNVLIYMEPYLQKKALATFHYALCDKGYLLLGKSETISGVPDLFAVAAANHKIFIPKNAPHRFFHAVNQQSTFVKTQLNHRKNSDPMRTDFQKIADDLLLSKYTPAGVVVNELLDIVQFRGNTSNFLQQTSGKPTHHLLAMAKEGLAFELRNILHKAKKENATVLKENIPIVINDIIHQISLEAIPLPNTIDSYFLILFHDQTLHINSKLTAASKKTTKQKKDANLIRLNQLEQDLAQTRDDMRSITEDQEAANEELQSANEELLSGSEEMQSLNEELETSKEELLSTNEELTTINQEMIGLNDQLEISKDYAEAIVANIREPLLILNTTFHIQQANNAFYNLFQIKESEIVNALVFDIVQKQWNLPALKLLLEKILPEKSVFKDFKIRHQLSDGSERILLLNAREVINKKSFEKLILLSIEDITDRKKAEKFELQRQAQYRQLLKVLPAVTFSCDVGGYVIFYNDAAQALWGFPPKVGKEVWHKLLKIVNQDGSSIPLEKNPIASHFKEGKAVVGRVITVKNFAGELFQYIISIQPELSLKGDLKGTVCILNDISERSVERKKLEESEHRFRLLIEEAYVATALFIGIEMQVQYANDIMLGYWGKTKSALGKPLHLAVPELVGQPFLGILNNVYTTGIAHKGVEEIAQLKIDGKLETFYFNYTYKPLRDKEGTIYGIHVMSIDVTKEVIVKRKLAESELQFRTLADAMPQKVWTADSKGNFNYFNNCWYEYTNLNFDQLKNNGWQNVLHASDLADTKKKWKLSIKTGRNFEVEHRLMNSAGLYKWHLTRGLPQRNKSGAIILWIGTVTEVHVQQEQKEILESVILERATRLKEANAALEIKNKELESFNYVSSHDLQEPLRKIQTFASRILEKEAANLSESGKNYFHLMQDAANRMQILIADLLSFSRLTKTEIKFELTNLSKIISKVKEDLKETIIEKNAIIELHDICDVHVIAFQFHQLMQNLIGNALKFSKEDVAPLIQIKSRIILGKQSANKAIPSNLEYCHISVSDNGIGFEKEFTEKIFEVFQKLHTKDEYSGTGIGLAIVKKIMDNHNGFITAKSKLTEGTTFDLYFPTS